MDYILAARKVFKNPIYLLLGWTIFFLLIVINFYVITGESGDLRTRISVFASMFRLEPWNILISGILIILAGMALPMSIYANREAAKTKNISKGNITSITGAITTIISTIMLTATCVACISPFVALIGVGGVLFLQKYSLLLSIISLLLVLLSIHWASEKVLGICKTC